MSSIGEDLLGYSVVTLPEREFELGLSHLAIQNIYVVVYWSYVLSIFLSMTIYFPLRFDIGNQVPKLVLTSFQDDKRET